MTTKSIFKKLKVRNASVILVCDENDTQKNIDVLNAIAAELEDYRITQSIQNNGNRAVVNIAIARKD